MQFCLQVSHLVWIKVKQKINLWVQKLFSSWFRELFCFQLKLFKNSLRSSVMKFSFCTSRKWIDCNVGRQRWRWRDTKLRFTLYVKLSSFKIPNGYSKGRFIDRNDEEDSSELHENIHARRFHLRILKLIANSNYKLGELNS